MAAERAVGGLRNRVVEWHADACQHCGAYAPPANARCVDCGVRVHQQCIEFTDGRCDLCRLGVPETTRCALCEVEDPTPRREDDTDRLLKAVLGFGRTWSWATDQTKWDELTHEVLHGGEAAVAT